jgi:hypothetical protein
MTLEGRSGPSLERVKRGIHVAIMGARTLRTASMANPPGPDRAPQTEHSWWRIWHPLRRSAYRLRAIYTPTYPEAAHGRN